MLNPTAERRRSTSWRSPHVRTPGYLFGASGVIERYCGVYSDPSLLAFGVDSGPPQHLYRVRFEQHALWLPVGLITPHDTVDVEIYECWLEPAPDAASSLPWQSRSSCR